MVLMALRKEPNRRYGSVQQMIDDIDRYLTGFPVVDEKGRVLGIVTNRDMRFAEADDTPVKVMMTSDDLAILAEPADLDEAIKEMVAYDGPVIMDVLVEKHENCFPMIPSGEPHNKMLLGEASTKDAIKVGGAVLV